jgi:hypothetical protein
MIYKILILTVTFLGAFVFSSNIYAMKFKSRHFVAVARHTTAINLADCYNASISELNLTNHSLSNKQLESMFFDIQHFIEEKGVQRLILDSNNLNLVPFELLGLGLVNETLKYISLKGNPFRTDSLVDFYMRARMVGLPIVGQSVLIIEIAYGLDVVQVKKIPVSLLATN